MKTTITTIRLTLDITYDPNGVPTKDLKDMVENIAKAAADRGLMTGETPATVGSYNYKVKTVRTPANARAAIFGARLPWIGLNT